MRKLTAFYLIVILFISCKSEQGEIGPKGTSSLINVVLEPSGLNCPSGGYKLENGIDIDSNGVLDTNEVQSTQYICNGDNGMNSLINVTEEVAGDNCSNGGFKIEVGIDLNGNGVLDTEEVQSTQYICNGENGKNSLINVTKEVPGDNCASGGFKIELGIDFNGNEILDADEIQSTQYICNGENGKNSLINITEEEAGDNCLNGGFKIEVGIDLNDNGVLDTDEIQSTDYICNKEDSTIDTTIFNDNWTSMEGPVTNPLLGVWGTSNSFYAVGGSTGVSSSEHLGIILKYEDNVWRIEKNDWNVRMVISDIDGVSDNEIYAVGKIWDSEVLTGVFLEYDGESWTETHYSWQPTKVKVIDGEVYVTATNSLYKLINGTLVKVFNYNFHGIDLWGTSMDNLYLVGFSGENDYIYHFDGISWTNMLQNSNISGSFLNCIKGSSNNEIYAAGSGGNFLKYDGNNWEVIKDGFDPIYDLHIVDSENIYFVTGLYASNGKIYKYDGTNFNLEYISQATSLYGIWEYEGVGLIVVASDGEIIAKRIN